MIILKKNTSKNTVYQFPFQNPEIHPSPLPFNIANKFLAPESPGWLWATPFFAEFLLQPLDSTAAPVQLYVTFVG